MKHKIKALKLAAPALLLAVVLSACGGGAHEHEDSTGGHHGDAHAGHGDAEGVATSNLMIDWEFGAEPAAGVAVPLTLTVKEETGEPVKEFDIGHDKKMHLIVVDATLTEFQHLHPEQQADGSFALDVAFEHGGQYTLFADFIPKGEGAMTLSQRIEVQGTEPSAAALQPDADQAKEVAGMKVALNMPEPVAGEEVSFSFTFEEAESGEPVNDLEMYLGAVGHVVILDSKAEKYLHNHPIDEKSTGPEAEFETVFPEAGTYKVWGQFQRGGELLLVPFVVEVRSQ